MLLVSRIAAIFSVLAAAAVLAVGTPARADDLVAMRAGRTIRVTALGDSVLRVRITPAGKADEDASWAVPANVRARRAAARVTPSTLTTAALRVSLAPRSLALRIEDRAGRLVTADDSRAPLLRDAEGFTLRKRLGADEHIFGLGDKTGPLDRRGRSFVGWNTDAYGFGSGDDPIYKTVPFFISSGGAGGAYGLFLDNSRRSWFDLGHRNPDIAAFGAAGGPIDYYVIAGPGLRDVVRRYADLTGHAPLPPRWALGYQQSRWSYGTEAEVRALADRLRQERVPTDVIWLDIDFQERNRPFTIDATAFPHFREMVGDLARQGIKLVAITDLHIAHLPGQNHRPYDSGAAGGHFLRRADGSPYVAPVWPGPAVFPDFTRAATREWWGGLFSDLTADGIAGIWNDMNEPAIFDSPTKTMPLDVIHRIEGDDFAARDANQAELHNVYGMENSRATYEGLRRLRPGERAFVMTRASFAGGQRYAVTWTGDNSSTWEHLKLAIAQTLNLGLSGFAWTGADVGGFIGGASPELMTRWFEYAAFMPIFRNHASKPAPRAEPWVDGPDHLAIRRRFVEERYRLLPFLYALAADNARTGDPVMRPLAYDFPAASGWQCDTAMTFTLGGVLLVAGDPKPESPTPYEACLPPGGWYDYWTGEPVAAGPAPDGAKAGLMVTPRLDSLPVFVRAGTILPRQPLVESTSERPVGPLELHVYPGPDCRGAIYDDDGHSLAFEQSGFLMQAVTCTFEDGRIRTIRFAPRQGRFAAWWSEIAVTIHAPGGYRASLDGKALSVTDAGSASRFVIADQPGGARIELSACAAERRPGDCAAP